MQEDAPCRDVPLPCLQWGSRSTLFSLHLPQFAQTPWFWCQEGVQSRLVCHRRHSALLETTGVQVSRGTVTSSLGTLGTSSGWPCWWWDQPRDAGQDQEGAMGLATSH